MVGFTGTSTNRVYNVGQSYASAGRIYTAQSDGTFVRDDGHRTVGSSYALQTGQSSYVGGGSEVRYNGPSVGVASPWDRLTPQQAARRNAREARRGGSSKSPTAPKAQTPVKASQPGSASPVPRPRSDRPVGVPEGHQAPPPVRAPTATPAPSVPTAGPGAGVVTKGNAWTTGPGAGGVYRPGDRGGQPAYGAGGGFPKGTFDMKKNKLEQIANASVPLGRDLFGDPIYLIPDKELPDATVASSIAGDEGWMTEGIGQFIGAQHVRSNWDRLAPQVSRNVEKLLFDIPGPNLNIDFTGGQPRLIDNFNAMVYATNRDLRAADAFIRSFDKHPDRSRTLPGVTHSSPVGPRDRRGF